MTRALFLATLCACTTPPDEPLGPLTCPADSPAEGEVNTFATGLEDQGTQGSEGLTFSPAGRLFVGGVAYSGGGFLAEVSGDGGVAPIVSMTSTVGLAWWQDTLLVAVGSDGPAGELGGVMRVNPDTGASEVFASGIPGANFIVVTPWDSLLVSSPGGTTVFQVTDTGVVTEWLTGIESPNGMVFSNNADTLFIAQTYTAPIALHAVDVSSDGQAGDVRTVALFDDNATLDGIALDVNGDILVLSNLPGELLRVTPDGDVDVIADGLNSPASLAFGSGDFDPCSVYITSLFSDVVYEVGVGTPSPFAVNRRRRGIYRGRPPH
ncbi:MAG: sugar lactone lactonase YvrE [Myxococcota bacterium]|jgi:sugar lactone lactonase YvrE